MLINKNTAISTSSVLLVPYEASHKIQAETASEPLSLMEEYAMQKSWRSDGDKLTFIACLPLPSPPPSAATTITTITSLSPIQPGTFDGPAQMIGDVNLFLSPADEDDDNDDDEGVIGELELMIAPTSRRRQGYGRAAILAFMQYITTHLSSILAEFGGGDGDEDEDGQTTTPRRTTRRSIERKPTTKLSQLKVKIGSKNEKSIALFESIGFVKVGEGPNYFGELELVFGGSLEEGSIKALREKFGVDGYEEVAYGSSQATEQTDAGTGIR
ncbi:uncharacterized protein L3040_007896 [Drepanopeziza brunnea f. sp. 'multigermtubi']|uniref:uncharacterized protein n=1 Tax=Drepanopeziza brunnea f. sp. 'multigermtubi' TaxID=698441 RepID=UPI00239B178D|nr:hypothetical protein L3040_007896 [Drepanopeziza brunnea f. sp. 'multigermtubi']